VRLRADSDPVLKHILPPPPPNSPSPPVTVELSLSSILLSFDGIAGSSQASQQSLQLIVYATYAGVRWQATAQSSNGGWLSVSPSSGIDDANFTISASPQGLAKGTYKGTVVINCPEAVNSPGIVDVFYTVRDPQPSALQLTPAALNPTAMAGASPVTLQLTVDKNGETGIGNWKASAASFNGGNWLSVAPASGSGAGVVNVTADPAVVTEGSYSGKITITADGMTNSPLQVPVTFTVSKPKLSVAQQAVVNGASFQPGALAPGEIASIFGVALGPKAGLAASLDPGSGKLPVQLGGLAIAFDGIPAPLFFTSYAQATFQVPFELGGKSSAQMVITVDGEDPATLTVPLADAAPGVFTLDNTRAVVLNQDSTLNSPQNPASPGSIIQIFFTGQGLLDSDVRTGVPAPVSAPFPASRQRVNVQLDGNTAPIIFSGLAPGLVGLAQVNAQVPAGVGPSDQIKMVVAVGSFASPGTIISVH
jgi:uncharacterized protein (TIGR03437 family)